MSQMSTISTMSIEDVIERINDLGVVASDVKEYQYLEKKFIENFNNEYEIIEKGTNNSTNVNNNNDILSLDKGEMIDFCLKS